MRNTCNKNYETQLKGIKEDIGKWKHIPHSWIGRLNIFKTSHPLPWSAHKRQTSSLPLLGGWDISLVLPFMKEAGSSCSSFMQGSQFQLPVLVGQCHVFYFCAGIKTPAPNGEGLYWHTFPFWPRKVMLLSS